MHILTVIGTRPDAIKMAPVIQQLRKKFGDSIKVCATAQHREMLDQVLSIFNIVPDYDLNIMQSNQSLSDITSFVLQGIEKLLKNDKPDRVLVQGDTTTAMAAAMAAFYQKIPVDHIEAGLRSHDPFSPWPEEMNRKITDCLTDLHFAPTKNAAENLLNEGINKNKIFITGNTVVDALIQIRSLLEKDKKIRSELDKKFAYLDSAKKLILVTGHRRESFGTGFKNICEALAELSKKEGVQIIYPVHLNPNVKEVVPNYLGSHKNIFLIEPQDYVALVYLMQRSYLVLTDSGGIQEEAPTFGKPVLVMRNVTERPEAVASGISKIVGTNVETIVSEAVKLLNDKHLYEQISVIQSPFGDGHAAERIVDVIASTV